RRDLLPGRLRREDGEGHRPAGRPQPGLADAVHLVPGGRRGHADPLRPDSHRLLEPEGDVVNNSNLTRYGIPAGVVAGAAGDFLAAASGQSEGPAQTNGRAAGSVPVHEQGRVKPMDSLARACLLQISKRDYYSVEDDKGNKTVRPAIEWLYDVMTCPRR